MISSLVSCPFQGLHDPMGTTRARVEDSATALRFYWSRLRMKFAGECPPPPEDGWYFTREDGFIFEFDAWERPIRYTIGPRGELRVVSSGQDGVDGTADDQQATVEPDEHCWRGEPFHRLYRSPDDRGGR